MADVDFIDVTPRPEPLNNIAGQPILLQLGVVPSYALTIHKVQALSLKWTVMGCLEGVFASGQVYVLLSRVTDPRNVVLLGVPPADLLPDVVKAWQEQGKDVPELHRQAVQITRDFTYDEQEKEYQDRIKPRKIAQNRLPVRNRTMEEVLEPQPWVGKVTWSSFTGVLQCLANSTCLQPDNYPPTQAAQVRSSAPRPT